MAKIRSTATYAGQPPINGRERQCEAALANDTKRGKRGDRCPNSPIVGGNVCAGHGGRAPQTKEAAQVRIQKLVDPSLDYITDVISPKNAKTAVEPSLRLRAAQDILDRSGHSGRQKLEVTGAFASLDIKNLSEDMLRQILTLKEQLGQAQPVEKPAT